MNNTIKELMERKSTRQFSDREITNEEKGTILLAASNAPTAGNMQMYSIIDVTDQGMKERLAVFCDNQPFIATAKMVLIFVADYIKWTDAFEIAGANPRTLGKGDLLLAIEDTVIAAQNAVTAAESLGIGSCYIGDIMENHDQVKELLNLPDQVYPACMLVFGYPTEDAKNRVKPKRFPLKHLVFENTYKRRDEETIRDMFSGKTSEYEQWLNAFCTRKYNSDFSLEMSESAEKYLKEFE